MSMSPPPLEPQRQVRSPASPQALQLPAPRPPAVTLGQALQARRSSRSFAPNPLRLDEVSTLLWAAFGINRREAGGRTAPSAHGWQEIDLYAVFAEGAWRYDPAPHRLARVAEGDLRAATGVQDFVAGAPLNLVYVADFARMGGVRNDETRFLAAADAGCIAENVYLCCAAMGLATVVRGLLDRGRLAAALQLAPEQRVILAQTVGYPMP